MSAPSLALAEPAQQHSLTCGPNKTIAAFVKLLQPGDTLQVSGTCHENLVIGAEVERVTLDGQGVATIDGNNGDPAAHTVTIMGRDVTVRGFTITGGANGIAVQDGASAEIDRNTIHAVGRNGIFVARNSTARILDNVIRDNLTGGINVGHGSSALIGFTGPPGGRESHPNTIQDNGGHGIQVVRGSHAQIFTNTIRDNLGNGVHVDRNSQVEIAACEITGNAGHGVLGMRGAAIDFGVDDTGQTTTFDDDTNTGTNGGFGVRCQLDGYVDGRLGTLTGALGALGQPPFTLFTEGCINSLMP